MTPAERTLLAPEAADAMDADEDAPIDGSLTGKAELSDEDDSLLEDAKSGCDDDENGS